MNSRTDQSIGIAFLAVAILGMIRRNVITRVLVGTYRWVFRDVSGTWAWTTIGVAAVLVTLSITAWWKNESIVVWLLVNGYTDEASTRTLPGIIDLAALVGLTVGSVTIGSSTIFRSQVTSLWNSLRVGSVATAGATSRTATVVRSDFIMTSSLTARVMGRLQVRMATFAARLKLLIERSSGRVAADARIVWGVLSTATAFVWRHVARAFRIVNAATLIVGVTMGWALLSAWRRINRASTVAWRNLTSIAIAVNTGATALLLPPLRLIARIYRLILLDTAIALTAIGNVSTRVYRTIQNAAAVVGADISIGFRFVGRAISQAIKMVVLGISLVAFGIYISILTVASATWLVITTVSTFTWAIISMSALKVERATEIALARTGSMVYTVSVAAGRVISVTVRAIALVFAISTIVMARAISASIAWTYGWISRLASQFWHYLTLTANTVWHLIEVATRAISASIAWTYGWISRLASQFWHYLALTANTVWHLIEIAATRTANGIMATVRPPARYTAIAFARTRHGLFVAAVTITKATQRAYQITVAVFIRGLRTPDAWAWSTIRAIGTAERFLYGRVARALSITVHAISRLISITFHAIGRAITYAMLLAMLGGALAAIAVARTIAVIVRPVHIAFTAFVGYMRWTWRLTVTVLRAIQSAVLAALASPTGIGPSRLRRYSMRGC